MVAAFVHRSVSSYRLAALALFIAGFGGTAAQGGVVQAFFSQPTLDRWMYPFNGTPGGRVAISVFSAIGQEVIGEFSFDQRDAQFIVGFDTAPAIPAGMVPCDFTVTSVVLTATTTSKTAGSFAYDPTYDSFQTYLDPGNPLYQSDTDVAAPGFGLTAARPLELYGAAFRGGFSLATFQENSPFGPIQTESRNCYPTDAVGGATDDVSNNVREQFDPKPFAIGTAPLTPGQAVPGDTTFTFNLDVNDPDVQNYLKAGVIAGRLLLIITSLQPATTPGGGGPGSGEFATFYSKEDDLFGFPATLDITIEMNVQGDADGNGVVNIDDLTFIVLRLGQSGGPADVDCSGTVDIDDITFAVLRLGN